jgi:hypothetical protein
MCNARGHSYSCLCGWGGTGHLGRRPLSFESARTVVFWDDHVKQLRPNFRSRNSFTTPNAKCPVCSASVYFYRSEFGGRVFFDNLGPPWPKHPCTSSQAAHQHAHDRPIDRATLDKPAREEWNTSWQSNEWEPFIIQTVDLVQDIPELLRIEGFLKGRLRIFFSKIKFRPKAGLAHLRNQKADRWEMSFFQLSANGEIVRTLADVQISRPSNPGSTDEARSSQFVQLQR